MDVVKEIEQLILLEKLYNAIDIDKPLIGAILVRQLVEYVENHLFLIIHKVVAFLLVLLSVDPQFLVEHVNEILLDFFHRIKGKRVVPCPFFH
jgi:hypothetical protein